MTQYELNLLDYWLIVRKRRHLILMTAALVVIFTVALTHAFQSTPLYQASARVKYDRSSTFTNLFLESFSYSYGNDWNTQSQVIESLPVIEQAARELEVVPRDAPTNIRRSKKYLSLLYSLQKQINAEPEENTSIIKITATDDDPDRAERIANAVAEAYRAENIRARNRLVTNSLRFVESQLAMRERKLNESEEALRMFKEREGQVFLTEEAKAALVTFTKLEVDYNRIFRIKEQTSRQIDILKGQQTIGGDDGERIFAENPSTILATLNGRLVEMIQERNTLLIDYTPKHPTVKLLDRKIHNVRSEMLRELSSKHRSLDDQQAVLDRQIERYRGRYLDFPQAAIRLARLEREVKVNVDLYATLRTKQQELLVKSAERIEEVSIIAPAVASTIPINAPKNQLNLLVGTVMGVFLGVVLAFTRESFDTSIGTIEGIEEFLKVPVLGVIAQFDEKKLREIAAQTLPSNTSPAAIEMFSKLPCLIDPTSILAEHLRSLRTNIQFANMDQRVKSIVISSVGLGEGKSTTVLNLAVTLAQEGQRVLLIDADLRKPTIHKRLGLKRGPGLAEALIEVTPWKSTVRTVTDLMLGPLGVDTVMNSPGLDNLHIMTSGTMSKNPAECLNLKRVSALIADIQQDYDVVLFDTPPILPVTDAVTVSSCVDGTILIYQVGRIGRSALKRAKFLLDHAKANVLGVVLTNVNAEITPEYGYLEYHDR